MRTASMIAVTLVAAACGGSPAVDVNAGNLGDDPTVHGAVATADGARLPFALVTLFASSGGGSTSTAADGNGTFSLQTSPGTYDVYVRFSNGAFTGTGLVASGLVVGGDTAQDLTVADAVLSGRVVDPAGVPVAGVVFAAHAFGPDDLAVTTAQDGTFSARIIPGDYAGIVLTPEADSGYATTPLPDQALPGAGGDFVIGLSSVHGTARRTGGEPLPLAAITFLSRETNNSMSTTADAAGNYSINEGPGTYDITVRYGDSVFTGTSQAATALVVSGGEQLDLSVEDTLFNGRVIDTSGAPVPGAVLSAHAFGPDDLSVVAGPDGSFSVRILAGSYFGLELGPPANSQYAVTPLSDQELPGTPSQDFVIAMQQ